MLRIAPFLILTTFAAAPLLSGQNIPKDILPSAAATTSLPALPADPTGRRTVIGGEIRNVDPVRDQFTLKVFGGRSMQVLFDERTEIYRDGNKIPVLTLRPEDHASVETTLDGTKVFALRIHMLSKAPEGECRGQISSYNSQTGDLTLRAAASQELITLHIPAGTPVVRVGQEANSGNQGSATDLTHGALVDVKFTATNKGQGSATRLDVIAVPGSAFTFIGNLQALDAHAGRLVIVDPNDNESYPIVYDPSRFPVARELRVGVPVKAVTQFDGTRYVASDISAR